MKNKYIFTAVLLLVLSLIGAGIVSIGGLAGKQRGSGEMKVVASFYPMYIAAENVIGDVEGVTLETLTDPKTGCLHDYQLTPEDMIRLSSADLFVINGGGIEGFVEEVAENCQGLSIVTASEGISYRKSEDGAEEEIHKAEEEHRHDHGDINAHVWMDVSLYEKEVENIANALAEKDPAHEEEYHANAEAYREKLEALRERLNVLKEKAAGKRIIIFHDAFAYFADAFGLDVAHIINMDENTSLSANEVSEIVELVRAEKIDMLFAEEQYGTKLADAVSRETDASVYVLDSLVTGEDDPDSYIRGMEENLTRLEQAFGEEGQ